MAELVATMLVGPLLSIVKEKASYDLLDQYKVMKGMEEQHEILMRKLPAILDVIADAEQEAAHREGAKAWLDAIKKVAYQANEVFDEFKYEALRRQAKEKGHYTELGFHVIKLFPTHNRFVFRHRMGNKLRKIVQDIEVLVAEMNAFGFQYKQQAPTSKLWRQTDHAIFDPHEIIRKSRRQDSKNIVDILLGQSRNADFTVVPIVGIGGLGKTALAQLVYDDPEIQKHFDLLLWVCVSDSFDVDSLAKCIVEAARKKNFDREAAAKESPLCVSDSFDVDSLAKCTVEASPKKNFDREAAAKESPPDILKSVVSGQKYLLVLDDVWNRKVDKWEKLKASLQNGGKGSAVLTTTREKGIAKIMGTFAAYNLTTLKDEYIREIIEARAFSLHKEVKRSDALVEMVGKIVKRCAGSPLAATALGSVLRDKTEEEWKAVSNSSIICTEESGILPILKLSYNDLPSQMKQCFAFCAVFPKDYAIDVEKLVQLWIANGFIQEQEGVRLETTGNQIFTELASRSFFQDVKEVHLKGFYYRRTCKIHDLMHDVALSIMEKERAVAVEESSQINWLTNTTRHLFLSCDEPEKTLNASLNERCPAIQTLLCDSVITSSVQHLSKYSSLRALQFSTETNAFPLRPKNLHHLRYLDLSRSYIKALPEDISILYNLQTLNLSYCSYLDRLPWEMKYMTSLRHLYTHGCLKLKSMPPCLRELASLQTLTCFVAGTGSGCSSVSELQDLNLGGELELRQLENVREEDAKAANLAKKKELKKLELKWSYGCEKDSKVLEGLEPSKEKLQAISIDSYGGASFPTWMVLLPKMVEIHLFGCNKLQCLFNLDTSFTFPNLKELTLQHLPDLERLCETNNGGPGEEIIFPRLEKIIITNCGKLTALPGQMSFPNLQNACINYCPLKAAQLEAPNLGVLDMQGREEEVLLLVDRHLTSLTDLKLALVQDTETTSVVVEYILSEKWSHRKFPLAYMELNGLNSGVAELCACFLQLQDLTIRRTDALVHWPEKEFQSLVSLRNLTIDSCEKLTGYAEAVPPEPSTTSCERSQLLPSLESLRIYSCDSLVEVFNIPASLRKMSVTNCSKLESIFGRKQQQAKPASSILQGSFVPAEVASSSSAGVSTAEHFLLPYLESLDISRCDSLTGVLDLPPSLKRLEFFNCNGLRSLESSSGELPSLRRLHLHDCKNLSSLPDGPQAYSSLGFLVIRNCPCMKTLPTSMQQRLGSLDWKKLDFKYTLITKRNQWKSKICKYVANK